MKRIILIAMIIIFANTAYFGYQIYQNEQKNYQVYFYSSEHPERDCVHLNNETDHIDVLQNLYEKIEANIGKDHGCEAKANDKTVMVLSCSHSFFIGAKKKSICQRYAQVNHKILELDKRDQANKVKRQRLKKQREMGKQAK